MFHSSPSDSSRPPATASKMSQEKRRKKSSKLLRICDRLDILSRLDSGESPQDVAKFYNIARRTVQRIRLKRETIVEFSKSHCNAQTMNYKRIKNTALSPLDIAVYEWFKAKKDSGVSVTGPEIQEQALRINRNLGGSRDFKASSGWLQGFNKRHGIKMINLQGVGLYPTNVKSAKDFCDVLETIIQENDYKPGNIYNVVKNGIQWNKLPNDVENAGSLRILKDRVPLILSVNSDGSHRLPVLVSGRVQNPRSFGDEEIPLKYVFHGNGYPSDLFLSQWFAEVFVPAIEERRGKDPEKILLVMDTVPTVFMAHQAQEANVRIVHIPPEAMPFIQPLYQGIFERFRKMYKEAFLAEMVMEEGGKKYALSKKWTIRDCCCTIANVWNLFTREDFQTAWRKLMKIDELDDRNNQVVFYSCGVTEEPDADEQNEPGEEWLSSDVPNFENSARSDMETEDSYENNEEIKNIVPFEAVPQNCNTDSTNNQLEIEETNLREAMKQIEEIPSTNDALKAVTTIFKWANYQEDATRKDIWDIVKMRMMILQKKK